MARERFLIETVHDTLVIMPAREAGRLARLNNALRESKTWGEFLAAVKNDPVTMFELGQRFDGDLPPETAAFEPVDISGVREHTWPPWPLKLMEHWCPESVLALGEWDQALFDEILTIDPSLLNEVIEALAEEGIEGIEDPGTTVVDACGEWGYYW